MDKFNWRKIYKKAVTFSYDDGVEQDLHLLDIFNKYGMKCTFNINTGLDYNHGTWNNKGLDIHRLNMPEHVSDYSGHEIAVHTRTHPNLLECSEEQIRQEINDDIVAITDLFGTKPVGMAYPYGTYDDKLIKIIHEYDIRYSRGVSSTHSFDEQTELMAFAPTCHHEDEQLFELARQFIEMEPERPQIFYIWGHSYEFEVNHNWDRIEELCKLLSDKTDIFYGTNRQVLL